MRFFVLKLVSHELKDTKRPRPVPACVSSDADFRSDLSHRALFRSALRFRAAATDWCRTMSSLSHCSHFVPVSDDVFTPGTDVRTETESREHDTHGITITKSLSCCDSRWVKDNPVLGSFY